MDVDRFKSNVYGKLLFYLDEYKVCVEAGWKT